MLQQDKLENCEILKEFIAKKANVANANQYSFHAIVNEEKFSIDIYFEDLYSDLSDPSIPVQIDISKKTKRQVIV